MSIWLTGYPVVKPNSNVIFITLFDHPLVAQYGLEKFDLGRVSTTSPAEFFIPIF